MVKRAVSTIETNRRKPLRPLERQRMRPWICKQLDEEKTPGLSWYDKSKGIFKITWMHAALHGYNPQSDADLFSKWARHTGRLFLGDHKRWKATFRCALNSLPDVTELKKLGVGKGSNAFKVFQFLDERKSMRAERKNHVHNFKDTLPDSTEGLGERLHAHQQSDSDGEGLKDTLSDVSEMSFDCTQSDSDITMDQTSSSECENKNEYRGLPVFEKICSALESVTTTLPKHFSGSKFVRQHQNIWKDDTDDSLSTASSGMTDDEIEQVWKHVLDDKDLTEYSSDLWNTPVSQEVVTDENVTTYIMLTQSARQPVVTLPGTATNHYDITSLAVQ